MKASKLASKCRLFCLLTCLALVTVAGLGCDEYGSTYGYGGGYYGDYGSGYGGGGWYDYGFTDDYSDGSTNSFNMNPYTDVGAELDSYLADSWTTTY